PRTGNLRLPETCAALGHLNANSYPATSACSVNIQRMWKYRVFVRELDRVFSRGPKLLNAHIARMVVLYHDLQLEMFATAADRVKELELLTKEHLQMYFIRRPWRRPSTPSRTSTRIRRASNTTLTACAAARE